MMNVKIKDWNPTEHLDSPEMVYEYLKAVMEDGDTVDLIAALGDVSKAKGMTEISKKTDLNRQNLYKSLSPKGAPQFDTIAKVLKAFGLRLTIEPV